MQRDLFGDITKDERRTTQPKGYAARPGSGPKGETCSTCIHKAKRGRFTKCGLLKKHWTQGRGTDVLQQSPACQFWSEGWNVAEFNGVRVRAHPERAAEFFCQKTNTWEKLDVENPVSIIFADGL